MPPCRRLDGEWLDILPADDSRAIASRTDLVRINIVMRHAALMARKLMRFRDRTRTLVDLGGGDGLFMAAVARRVAGYWPGVRLVLIDNRNIVSDRALEAFSRIGWRCEVQAGDLFDHLDRFSGSVIASNLFLHHLPDASLQRLFQKAASMAEGIVACEPRRSTFGLAASRLVFILGVNDVTRHDAVASVRAGFRNKELSRLWPDRDWLLEEHHAWPFSHCFVAERSNGEKES
jgi:hypothetical protein